MLMFKYYYKKLKNRNKMSESIPQEPTQGQLEYAQKLVDAGEWDEDTEVGAQKIQDEVNAGRAEVIGTGAAVAVLRESERIENGGQGISENVSRRHVPIGHNELSEKMEMPNVGAALIGEGSYINSEAEIGDGSYLGAVTVMPSGPEAGASIGKNAQVGDYGYVAGKIGDGTVLGQNARIKVDSEIGNDVTAGDLVELESGSSVGDNSRLTGSNRIFGKVGSGSVLDHGVSVIEDAELPEGSVVVGQHTRVTPDNASSFAPEIPELEESARS